MKNKFKQLPAILQRQILTRLVLGGFFILLFVILIFTTKDIVLALLKHDMQRIVLCYPNCLLQTTIGKIS